MHMRAASAAGTFTAEPALCLTLRVGVVAQRAREAWAATGALAVEGRDFTALLLSCSCDTLVFSMSRLSLCSARRHVASEGSWGEACDLWCSATKIQFVSSHTRQWAQQ